MAKIHIANLHWLISLLGDWFVHLKGEEWMIHLWMIHMANSLRVNLILRNSFDPKKTVANRVNCYSMVEWVFARYYQKFLLFYYLTPSLKRWKSVAILVLHFTDTIALVCSQRISLLQVDTRNRQERKRNQEKTAKRR